EVATLVNKNYQTGNYTVEFNANDLPSGIYLYRLSAGNFVSTKKMILMK
ncbi:MAG: T9SS type A sorting domain-containing protein, partial [Ignavibacteria bacterium]|nr:T9SS type A sorting domain-containing protein [Ignavibacteria bacterium]